MPPQSALVSQNSEFSNSGDSPDPIYSLSEKFKPLKNAKIMMIDDESITLRVMRNLLENAGYCEFFLVDDSTQAMRKLREHRPDVVLLDVLMPNVSGFDILQEMCADKDLAHVPVIILTSSTDADTKLKALDLGASDFLSKPVDPSELALRVRNTLAAKAYQDQLSYYDPITNLPNRYAFEKRLEWAVTNAELAGHEFSLLHLTFNEFKRVCDTFGLKIGDDVLEQISDRLVGNIRTEDFLRQPILAGVPCIDIFSLSGSAFSILILNNDENIDIAAVAQRIISVMESPFVADMTEIYLSPSIGISNFPLDATSATLLENCAISACSQVSENKDGLIQFYSSSMTRHSVDRLQLEAELRQALVKRQFKLLYQPKIDVKTGHIIGAEALCRWYNDHNIEISPGVFIPIAEETGLILPIGEWVLQEACQQIVRWREANINIKVAVNVSGRQFFGTDIVSLLNKCLLENNIGPESLTLEITESFMIEGVDKAIEILEKLKTSGFEISIDDFGTGYSSLSYLKLLKADEVKIDRSFIMDMVDSKEDQALVSGVTYLAHELGLQVCAEGVENREQLELLKKFNIDVCQGFYFDRPLRPREFALRYHENSGY